MITQEKQAIELAKRVFEHFSKDGLGLAREIIALENQIQTISAENSDQHGKPATSSEITFPTSDITPDEMGLTTEAKPDQPLTQGRTIESDQDSLPF